MPHTILDSSTRVRHSEPTHWTASSIGGRRPCNSSCCCSGLQMPASRSQKSDPARTTSWQRSSSEKPAGILLFCGAARAIGARLPAGLQIRDLLVVGTAAAIGFTVLAVLCDSSLPGGRSSGRNEDGRSLAFRRRTPRIGDVANSACPCASGGTPAIVRAIGLKPLGARHRNRIRRSPNYGSQLR